MTVLALSSLDQQLRGLGVERDPRLHPGRLAGTNIYIHRLYAERLPADLLAEALHEVPQGWQYTVIKFDRNIQAFSFIHSPDFDTADDPEIGDSITVKRDGQTYFRSRCQRQQLWHHKWLMVTDMYTGFDVEASKRHSLRWLSLPGLDNKHLSFRDDWRRHVLSRMGDS